MLPNIGFGELVLILAILLLLFGASRLPEAAKGLGKSINAFKEGLRGAQEEEKKAKIAKEAEKKV